MFGYRSEKSVVALGESIMGAALEVPECILIDALSHGSFSSRPSVRFGSEY